MPFSQDALSLSALMDAALSFQLRQIWGRQPAIQSLESQFPAASTKEIGAALADATMLLASAFSAGHEALTTVTPDVPAIIGRLRARHPGFSDSGYCSVIDFGCFLAR